MTSRHSDEMDDKHVVLGPHPQRLTPLVRKRSPSLSPSAPESDGSCKSLYAFLSLSFPCLLLRPSASSHDLLENDWTFFVVLLTVMTLQTPGSPPSWKREAS